MAGRAGRLGMVRVEGLPGGGDRHQLIYMVETIGGAMRAGKVGRWPGRWERALDGWGLVRWVGIGLGWMALPT